MTQRELSTTTNNNFLLSSIKPISNCWWSDEVLSPAEPTPSYRDFVLISEFSELEGPLPLAVVANNSYIDLKHYTDKPCPDRQSIEEELKKIGLEEFDFNAFVLRVVSVDRSTEYEQIDEELIEPLTPSSVFADESSPPCIFSIPDDTQVYFTDSVHKFFAFTHHLILFDINARGYVHPVALSYITRDPDKIVIRFEELMEQFNQVSIKMKKGNYSNFTLDLKCRLLDLEYTAQQQKPALSVQAIQQATTTTKLMIDTLESSTSLSSSAKNDTKDVVKEKHVTTIDPPKDYQPKCIDSLYPVPHFERKLRTLAQLCQEPDEEEPPTVTMKRPSLIQKIPLMFSIIEPKQQQQRSTFSNAITHDMYSEAIKSIQDMTQCLGKSSVVLDVNEEESTFVDPVSSAITFGRTFMLNMDNPQPREEEKDATDSGLASKDELPTTIDEKSDVGKEETKEEEQESTPHSSAQETDDDESYYPVLLAPLQLWKSEDQPPTHLLEVLRRYQSLIVDVIFSLMTGRTVLIQGSASNKSNVQQVVHALSVFVPGQSKDRHQIIDWFETTRLTDSQIKSIKLVGIDKENMDSSIHIEGSCVLDIDVKNGSLNSSPVYVEGQWINQLLDRMMLFSSDESYLAYLHTMFMKMSLKAFVYHHLYVCDEFKLLDETPSSSSAAVVNKGYTSETNSESSTLSRKWSVRLLSYLKKHEDQENEVVSRPPSSASSVVTTTSQQNHQEATAAISTDDDQDYSEENQATVTLQNLLKNNSQQKKPRTIVGLFGATSAGEPVTTTTNATASSTHTIDENLRRDSISTTYTRRSSSDSTGSSRNLSDDEYDLSRAPTVDGSFLNFGADDLGYFRENQSDDSSSEEEEEAKPDKKSRRHGSKHRSRKLSDVGPDGVSYTERRGRRYLQEKLKVYGDDQTIVVYLATCVL